MKTLVITDLHLNTKVRGLLDAQIKCISSILDKEEPDEVIMMGDIFMSRRPSPSVLVGFKKFLDSHKALTEFYILRGNHDSETKADDGITALSVFDDDYNVRVIPHTLVDSARERAFIPHYENEDIIIAALRVMPKGFKVFGHFGFSGSINSYGDCDFTIPLREFRNSCMLGHIHRFNARSIEVDGEKVVLTCLGTPYTTNFTEHGKDNFYATIEGDEVSYTQVTHGPRHLCIDYESIDEWHDVLSDTNYFNIVRVYVNKLSDSDNSLIVKDLLDAYPIDCLEIKYKPIFDDDQEENYYNPKTNPFDLNRDVLQEYVNNSTAQLDKDMLMKGLDLINEDKKSQN